MSTLHFTRRDTVNGDIKAVDLILNLNQPARKAGRDVLGRYLSINDLTNHAPIIDLMNHAPSAPCIALSMEVDRPASNFLIYVPVDKEYKNPSQVVVGNFTIAVLRVEGDDLSLHCGNLTADGCFHPNFSLTSLKKYAVQDPDTWINFNAALVQLCNAYLTNIKADPDVFVLYEQMSSRINDYLNRLIEHNAKLNKAGMSK